MLIRAPRVGLRLGRADVEMRTRALASGGSDEGSGYSDGACMAVLRRTKDRRQGQTAAQGGLEGGAT